MTMDGYRFSVERNRLLITLEAAREKAGGLPDVERKARIEELEREFRRRLDAIYEQARGEFEAPCGK